MLISISPSMVFHIVRSIKLTDLRYTKRFGGIFSCFFLFFFKYMFNSLVVDKMASYFFVLQLFLSVSVPAARMPRGTMLLPGG